MAYDNRFMKRAIEISIKNIDNGGGPFGAVIVKNGEIVAESGNRVTSENDPTAHAEVKAIRKAAEKMGDFDLSGCEIYCSCEPCPMCLGAIYWAHLDAIYYGNTKDDAKEIGFDDSFIYDEIGKEKRYRRVKTEQFDRAEAIMAFEKWKMKEDKTEY